MSRTALIARRARGGAIAAVVSYGAFATLDPRTSVTSRLNCFPATVLPTHHTRIVASLPRRAWAFQACSRKIRKIPCEPREDMHSYTYVREVCAREALVSHRPARRDSARTPATPAAMAVPYPHASDAVHRPIRRVCIYSGQGTLFILWARRKAARASTALRYICQDSDASSALSFGKRSEKCLTNMVGARIMRDG